MKYLCVFYLCRLFLNVLVLCQTQHAHSVSTKTVPCGNTNSFEVTAQVPISTDLQRLNTHLYIW